MFAKTEGGTLNGILFNGVSVAGSGYVGALVGEAREVGINMIIAGAETAIATASTVGGLVGVLTGSKGMISNGRA